MHANANVHTGLFWTFAFALEMGLQLLVRRSDEARKTSLPILTKNQPLLSRVTTDQGVTSVTSKGGLMSWIPVLSGLRMKQLSHTIRMIAFCVPLVILSWLSVWANVSMKQIDKTSRMFLDCK